ncbi:LPS export ABC transporter permease LptG [Pedomonas mirosovicensis]|uniref:LPS export ABC transporter permease LptG n=1 Tax=Pedomonas mirosovicensis TaxID=2908641 RepID=UPI002169C382|nr:LPS export ABC transporter permease LptG [Pedomonas mirosovicensis]MCH8685221.1 LPS export ABC transporter permease LptG [Pedomonas mirosovicensis]
MRLFPSSTLARYLGQMFTIRVLAFLIGLVMVLQTLDLLSESDKILAVEGNGYGALLHYVSLRMPQLISQFLPFSVLLGTLVTLATLNQTSEVVVMRAAGISAHQVLMPLVAAAGLIGLAHFVFNETVVVQSTAQLQAWERVGYAPRSEEAPPETQEVWVADGATIIHAREAIQRDGRLILPNFELYERREGSHLSRVTTAARAEYAGGTWTLYDVREYSPTGAPPVRRDTQPWHTNVQTDRFLAVAVDPATVSYLRLHRAVAELSEGGHPTESLLASLYHKISGPFSSVLMPLLAAVSAFGVVRSGKLFVRIVIGMALGFGYFVADNFMLAMGQFGTVPPFLAAWAAPLLFLCIGESVLFRTEE